MTELFDSILQQLTIIQQKLADSNSRQEEMERKLVELAAAQARMDATFQQLGEVFGGNRNSTTEIIRNGANNNEIDEIQSVSVGLTVEPTTEYITVSEKNFSNGTCETDVTIRQFGAMVDDSDATLLSATDSPQYNGIVSGLNATDYFTALDTEHVQLTSESTTTETSSTDSWKSKDLSTDATTLDIRTEILIDSSQHRSALRKPHPPVRKIPMYVSETENVGMLTVEAHERDVFDPSLRRKELEEAVMTSVQTDRDSEKSKTTHDPGSMHV